MAKDHVEDQSHNSNREQADTAENWIFVADPGTLPTEKLPSREDFERIRREMAHVEGPHEPFFAPGLDAESSESAGQQPELILEDSAENLAPAAAAAPSDSNAGEEREAIAATPSPRVRVNTGQHPLEPSTQTAEIAMPDGAGISRNPGAFSRQTPSAAPRAPLAMPPRFRDLSGWDALRDLFAIFLFVSAFATVFTHARNAVPAWIPAIAQVVAIATILLVYVLRWAPTYRKDYDPKAPKDFAYLGTIRKVGMIPAFAVAVGIMVYDLAMSIPQLLTPLPHGPKVGIGAGVAILLLGAVLGSERRSFEGFPPTIESRKKGRRWLGALRVLALVSFAIALVMLVGKAIHGDLLFSLVTLSFAIPSFAFVLYILNPKLSERPSWCIFLTGIGVALSLGTAADSTLKFDYAAPGSFSTWYVWLPFVLAGVGILLSRAHLRSTSLRFQRSDWVVYAARAFEFSFTMHLVGLVAAIVLGVALARGYKGDMSLGLDIFSAILLVIFAGLSAYGRKALSFADGVKARGHAVSSAVALTVLGFIGIVIFSVLAQDAAGIANGGLALFSGIAAALMLAVPTPVRDEHGAPDIEAMFAEFRARDLGPSLATRILPPAKEQPAIEPDAPATENLSADQSLESSTQL